MTRWVTNDLAGRIIAEQGLRENGGVWDVLKFPALNAAGEALWPQRYNKDMLYEIRASIGEKLFSALYQQEPVDMIERLFSDPRFEEPPKGLKLIAYLDPAFGGNDYSAFTAGGINDSIIYVICGEIWRGQIDETYMKVEALCRKLGVGTLFVESNQAQKAVVSEFRRRGIAVRDMNHVSNKHLRIVNAVRINWENIRFSKGVSRDYMQQLLGYSELAKHDDAADSLAGFIESLGVGGAKIDNRYDGFLNNLLFRW
jgi:predicted phage terminase large subunit-like protein